MLTRFNEVVDGQPALPCHSVVSASSNTATKFIRRVLVSTTLAIGLSLSSLANAGYYSYVLPFDLSVSEGDWGTVKGYSESQVTSWLLPQDPLLNCEWLTPEPAVPASLIGNWGGTNCGGTFLVTYVADACPLDYVKVNGNCEVEDGKLSPGASLGSPNNKPKMCPNFQFAANPIRIGTGNKYQLETDYEAPRSNGLAFRRSYNSQSNATGVLGLGWSAPWWAKVALFPTEDVAILHRPDGRRLVFSLNNGAWTVENHDPGVLTEQRDVNGARTGWLYVTPDDTDEYYDANGVLQSVTDRQRMVYSLQYNGNGELSTVSDAFGRELAFTYNIYGRIETMTDPDGGVYRYEYEVKGTLSKVSYPDDTPADDTDNPTRIYHYEDPAFRDALTGITDETGVRFATWTYDTQGRADSSSHANGVEFTALDYTHVDDPIDPRVTVTNPLGKDTTYHFTTLFGAREVTQVEGHATANCPSGLRNMTYDANGFPDVVTDFLGRMTDFDHGADGLESQRIEAQGTPEQRRIETQWHASYRVPVRIDVYDQGNTHVQQTTFAYDAQGRLLTRTETDTVTNGTRTVTNTYNAQGLLAAHDGPRTDVSDITTFAYDAQGNLTETTNAIGHVSKVTAYDAHGRPLALNT